MKKAACLLCIMMSIGLLSGTAGLRNAAPPALELMPVAQCASLTGSACDCEKAVAECGSCVASISCAHWENDQVYIGGTGIVVSCSSGEKCGTGGTKNCSQEPAGHCKLTTEYQYQNCTGTSTTDEDDAKHTASLKSCNL